MKDTRQLLIEHPIGNTTIIKNHTQSVKSVNEAYDLSSQFLPEGIADDAILIRGPVQRADVENKNGRIYPRPILEREVQRLNNIIKEVGGILGELDHPDLTTVALQRVPTCIRKLWWEDSTLMAIAEILDPKYNPNAGIAYSIAKAGLPLGISSRGLGSLSYNNGANVVQEDFEMVCWDLVSDPSTHSAYMRQVPIRTVKESIKEQKIVKETNGSQSIEEAIKKVLF